MVNFSVTQFGKPLSSDKYSWDESTKTFSTTESNLVLDFSGVDGVTFETGHRCVFYVGSNCTFYTSYRCTFDIGYGCVFEIGPECVAIRRDIFEIIQIPEYRKIKLNGCRIKGYEII